jgi:hypothetical protein
MKLDKRRNVKQHANQRRHIPSKIIPHFFET